MKIIDLLNKIAKGEEVPKEIEYQGTRYIFDENDYKLYKGANLLTENCLTSYINAVMLNDEIEIIEEKPKKIEKLEIEQIENNPSCYYIKNEYGTKCCLTKHSKIIAEKVNELQKAVNYLLEKESDK